MIVRWRQHVHPCAATPGINHHDNPSGPPRSVIPDLRANDGLPVFDTGRDPVALPFDLVDPFLAGRRLGDQFGTPGGRDWSIEETDC
jgi:hypothetical protein